MSCACEELGLKHGYVCGSPGCDRERERLRQVIKLQGEAALFDGETVANNEQRFRNALIVIAEGAFSAEAVKVFAGSVLAQGGAKW